jgi:hypothetical protein
LCQCGGNATDFPRPQFVIDARQPASDKIFDVSAFEKFLNEKIKVDGRVGNLGDIIKISQQGEGKVEITAHNELSGRYLKYLYGFPAELTGQWSRTQVLTCSLLF